MEGRSFRPGPAGFLDSTAGQLVSLIRAWSPVIPQGWVVTAPPAGASEGGPYPAGILGREVATRLGLDFQTCLARAKAKHGTTRPSPAARIRIE